MRYDAEGFLRSLSLIQWLESQGIHLQAISGEAPWQLGKHSRHLETVKANLTLLADELGPSVTCEELLDLTVSTKNEMHSVRGFSPNQWSFGQGKGRVESFLQNGDILPTQSVRDIPVFEENIKRRNNARLVFLKEDARKRLDRAALYRSRKNQEFEPGQLVYFFRRGRGHGSRYESFWFGPARVVCVEKTGDDSLNQTQGSIVWVAHATTLYRCAPEQLRLVTHELSNLSHLFGHTKSPSEMLEHIRGSHTYRDISRDVGDMNPGDDLIDENPDTDPALLRLQPSESSDRPRFRHLRKSPPSTSQDEFGSGPNPCIPQEEREAVQQGGASVSRQEDRSHGDQNPRRDDSERRSSCRKEHHGDLPREPILFPLDRGSPIREPEVSHDGPLRAAHGQRDQGLQEGRSDTQGEEDRGNQVDPRSRAEFEQVIERRRGVRDAQPIPEQSSEGLHHKPSHRSGHDQSDAGSQSTAHAADSGRSDDGARVLREHGESREHPGDNRSAVGRPSNSASRLRSRSRHRDHQDAILLCESPDVAAEPEPFTVPFDSTGCAYLPPEFQKSSKSIGNIRKGCFSWMDRNDRETSHREDNKEVLFACDKSEVLEIVMVVAPRDVHLQKRNGVSEWTLNQKPKKTAEVKFKTLNEQEQQEFRNAMRGELNSFLERDAVEIALREGIDPRKVLGMRWVLTWKPVQDKNGSEVGKRPKARLIIRGYEDPNLLHLRRDSPTLAVQSRNTLFSLMSMFKWKLFCGDIKTAFLNGDHVPENEQVFGEPPNEVREFMGMDQKHVLRIKKVIYGLLHAPRAWMQKLDSVLQEQGWCRSRLEPCVWRLYDSQDNLTGLIGCHVDDVLVAGEGEYYQERVDLLRKSFPFGSWLSASDQNVTFCGCEVKQETNFDIVVSQERYSMGINEIPLSLERKSSTELPANTEETKQLRAVLGALSWRATQTSPWLGASVSVLQGVQSSPTVADLLTANKLVRTQRALHDVPIRFCSNIEKPILITYTDASWACRRDGTSQGGQISVIADVSVLEGHRSAFSPVAWQSRKLARVARSSTSAEVQMASNATDHHEFLKQILLEWFNKRPVLENSPDQVMKTMPSILILDAKNLYDALSRIETSGLQLEEKRTAIDVLSIRERTQQTGILVKWVDSDQQLGDGLSKPNQFDSLLEILRFGSLSIVFDPLFVSAKRKRQQKRQKASAGVHNDFDLGSDLPDIKKENRTDENSVLMSH